MSDQAEYFANMFTGNTDKITAGLCNDFSLCLSIMTFKMLHAHILDHHVKSDNVKRKNVEQIPDMIVDQWLKRQLAAIRQEVDELKKQTSASTMGMVLGSVIGDPDELLKRQEKKIKEMAKMFRDILNKGV